MNIKNCNLEFYIKWEKEGDSIDYLVQFGIIVLLIPESMGFDLREIVWGLEQDWEKVQKQIEETKNMYLVKRTRHELYLVLEKYVKKYEPLMNVKVNRIRISTKPLKTTWATCSGKRGYLSFNCECLELPEHILEVLVVHEMVHIKYLNHQEDFYNEMEKYIPGARKKDKEINLYVDLVDGVKKYVD